VLTLGGLNPPVGPMAPYLGIRLFFLPERPACPLLVDRLFFNFSGRSRKVTTTPSVAF